MSRRWSRAGANTLNPQTMKKKHEHSGKRCLYFLGSEYVGVTHSPESTYILEPRASEYTFVPVEQAAAAPDLLAALHSVLQSCEEMDMEVPAETDIRAAIAKATGNPA